MKPAEVVHNFEGSWIIGRPWGEVDEKVTIVAGVVNKIFPVVKSSDIRAMKYLKIFVNASNCIPAILGVSMQEAFQDLEVAQASIGIWQEGLEIVKKAGINLVSLPDFPLERLTKLVSLPNFEAAKILSGIMTNLSKEPLYGSILQSIHRNRASEVDYINGEFLTLAKDNGLEAALNTRLVALVHEVERTKRFLSKKEFLDNVREVAGV